MMGYNMAIMGRPPRVPPVQSATLGEHPHIMIASKENKLINLLKKKLVNKTILKNAFINEIFLVREQGSGTRILLDRFLDEIGLGLFFHAKR